MWALHITVFQAYAAFQRLAGRMKAEGVPKQEGSHRGSCAF